MQAASAKASPGPCMPSDAGAHLAEKGGPRVAGRLPELAVGKHDVVALKQAVLSGVQRGDGVAHRAVGDLTAGEGGGGAPRLGSRRPGSDVLRLNNGSAAPPGLATSRQAPWSAAPRLGRDTRIQLHLRFTPQARPHRASSGLSVMTCGTPPAKKTQGPGPYSLAHRACSSHVHSVWARQRAAHGRAHDRCGTDDIQHSSVVDVAEGRPRARACPLRCEPRISAPVGGSTAEVHILRIPAVEASGDCRQGGAPGKQALAAQARRAAAALTATFSCPSVISSGKLPTSQRKGGPARWGETQIWRVPTASLSALPLPRTGRPPARPHPGSGGSATS